MGTSAFAEHEQRVSELLTTMNVARECAEIVKVDPANQTAWATVRRQLRVTQRIYAEIDRTTMRASSGATP